MKKIFTAGYTSRRFFEDAVLHPEVKRVVDVRTGNTSQIPHFNGDRFREEVTKRGKPFIHLQELGGKGKVSPERFKAGLRTLEEGDLLVCMEADVTKCHRKQMLEKPLTEMGYLVVHLLQKPKDESPVKPSEKPPEQTGFLQMMLL